MELPSATYVQCTLPSISFIRVSNAWVGLIVGQKTLSPCIDGVGYMYQSGLGDVTFFFFFFLHLQVEHLGAFRIVHSVEAPDGTKSETVFRFHHKSKLQAQAAVTVGGVCVGVCIWCYGMHILTHLVSIPLKYS